MPSPAPPRVRAGAVDRDHQRVPAVRHGQGTQRTGEPGPGSPRSRRAWTVAHGTTRVDSPSWPGVSTPSATATSRVAMTGQRSPVGNDSSWRTSRSPGAPLPASGDPPHPDPPLPPAPKPSLHGLGLQARTHLRRFTVWTVKLSPMLTCLSPTRRQAVLPMSLQLLNALLSLTYM